MTKAEFFQKRAVADFEKRRGVTRCEPGSAGGVSPDREVVVRLRRGHGRKATAEALRQMAAGEKGA
jgi:hypothetical protein